MSDLLMGLTQCFQFYNQERWHQALDYKTSDEVYQTARGGGARLTDKLKVRVGFMLHAAKRGQRLQLECEQSPVLNLRHLFPDLVGSSLYRRRPLFNLKVPVLGYTSHVIFLGRGINDSAGNIIAVQIVKGLIKDEAYFKVSYSAYLGYTFKENAPDVMSI